MKIYVFDLFYPIGSPLARQSQRPFMVYSLSEGGLG